MTIIAGASWSFNNSAETLYGKAKFDYDSLKDLHNQIYSSEIIKDKIKNFGRSSINSKLYSLLTGLALYDMGSSLQKLNRDGIGVISCSEDASINDNEKYYKDYVMTGKKMSRGNLFVYTLPTSPLGESAIAYNLKGPTLFVSFLKNQLRSLLTHTEIILFSKRADAFCTIFSDDKGSICLILTNRDRSTDSNTIKLDTLTQNIADNINTYSLIESLKDIL